MTSPLAAIQSTADSSSELSSSSSPLLHRNSDIQPRLVAVLLAFKNLPHFQYLAELSTVKRMGQELAENELYRYCYCVEGILCVFEVGNQVAITEPAACDMARAIPLVDSDECSQSGLV